MIIKGWDLNEGQFEWFLNGNHMEAGVMNTSTTASDFIYMWRRRCWFGTDQASSRLEAVCSKRHLDASSCGTAQITGAAQLITQIIRTSAVNRDDTPSQSDNYTTADLHWADKRWKSGSYWDPKSQHAFTKWEERNYTDATCDMQHFHSTLTDERGDLPRSQRSKRWQPSLQKHMKADCWLNVQTAGYVSWYIYIGLITVWGCISFPASILSMTKMNADKIGNVRIKKMEDGDTE